jgi:RNA polymerase sigma-70 factor (ECF subfamily)
MIKTVLFLHVLVAAMIAPELDTSERPPTLTTEQTRRLEAMFEAYFDFVWRTLRRFGLSDSAADDAAQQVFVVACRRVDDIERNGERAFLYGTARRVASDQRKSAASRREVLDDAVGDGAARATGADELTERKRARELLDRVMAALSPELREVLVLFELEGMTSAAIATLIGIPLGTVQSRLRRARESFEALADAHLTGRPAT